MAFKPEPDRLSDDVQTGDAHVLFQKAEKPAFQILQKD